MYLCFNVALFDYVACIQVQEWWRRDKSLFNPYPRHFALGVDMTVFKKILKVVRSLIIQDSLLHTNLSAGFFYKQQTPNLLTISRNNEFWTIEPITAGKKAKNKMDRKQTINIYHVKGLKVMQLNIDKEFA